MSRHKNATHFKMKYTTPICKKFFQSNSALKSQITIHKECKPFPCSFCCKAFTTKCNFLDHLNIHHSVQKQQYNCEICGKTFLTKLCLKIHINHVHNSIITHKCEFCAKKLSTIPHLQNHLLSHTPIKKYFKCGHCERSYVC